VGAEDRVDATPIEIDRAARDWRGWAPLVLGAVVSLLAAAGAYGQGAAVSIGPDGAAYVGVLGGLVPLRDGG
jgi:hypothetical protein